MGHGLTIKGRLDVRRGRTTIGLRRPSRGAVGLGWLLERLVGRVVWVGPRRVLDELLSRGPQAAERRRVVLFAWRVMGRVLLAAKADMLDGKRHGIRGGFKGHWGLRAVPQWQSSRLRYRS